VLVRNVLATAALLACACSSHRHVDWVDPSRLPDDVRSDYAVFASRCSKCHSLSRPLDSGIDDDDHWRLYVARMRRQPASGISREDVPPILRFLHYFSIEERRRKGKPLAPSTPPPALSKTAPPASSLASSAPAASGPASSGLAAAPRPSDTAAPGPSNTAAPAPSDAAAPAPSDAAAPALDAGDGS